jgi:hypothetical protein
MVRGFGMVPIATARLLVDAGELVIAGRRVTREDIDLSSLYGGAILPRKTSTRR